MGFLLLPSLEWAWQGHAGYVVLSEQDKRLQCVLWWGKWGTRKPEALLRRTLKEKRGAFLKK